MKKKRILIVEDEAITALNLRLVLERHNYEVAAVIDNGEEVLERIDEIDPDAVLMDIELGGGVDGIIVTERIEDRYPVIFVSATDDRRTRERIRDTKAYGRVPKPFSEKLLFSFLEYALEHGHKEKKDEGGG